MPIGPDSYGAFVGAAIGAEAVFLALFFTTVGVIASTAYARVPAETRDLFIRELCVSEWPEGSSDRV